MQFRQTGKWRSAGSRHLQSYLRVLISLMSEVGQKRRFEHQSVSSGVHQ
jgi:hypothetical protein